MIEYRFNEIQNKHGQRIYYFSKQPGNTELEKCINFTKMMNVKYNIFNTIDKNNNKKIDIVSTSTSFEVFNDIGDKVGECSESYNNITCLNDIIEDLEDLGFNI